MALGAIVQEYKGSLTGMLKIIIYKITDTGGSGGTVQAAINHICWANAIDLDGDNVTASWTDDSETITLGNSGAGHIVRLLVVGWGG